MKFRFPHWAFAIGFAMMLLQPLRAEAALSGGKFLTPQETLSAYGQTITGRYYNGSEYVDINFLYDTVSSIGTVFADSEYKPDIVSTGNQGLLYYATATNVSTNPQFIQFDLHPQFSLLNTSQIHACIALSGGGGVSNSVYSPPRWEWNINGLSTVFQSRGGAGVNYPQYWPSFYLSGSSSGGLSYVSADYTSNSPISGYSIRASFYGNAQSSQQGYVYTLFVGCPYVSSDASGQSGTLAPVTGTTVSTSSSVDIDLTETNSLLGSIRQGIENLANSILNGLKNLFIPSETFMTDWKDDMSDELEDHLGGIYEATDILHDWAAQFRNVQASSEIYVPAVTVPLAGVSWTVGDWHVPLKPSGMPALVYEAFALIVDFLALAAFLNMCHKKLEVVLVPESEKVD